MSNVIHLRAPRRAPVIRIHWASIAFMPLHELEVTLSLSHTWDAPLLFGDLVDRVARSLLAEELTDARAKALGWASGAVARERALDMLRLLDEYAERRLAARRETLHT